MPIELKIQVLCLSFSKVSIIVLNELNLNLIFKICRNKIFKIKKNYFEEKFVEKLALDFAI